MSSVCYSVEIKNAAFSFIRLLDPYNACCESFFKYLKKNRTNRRIYHTLEELRLDIFEYIENLYNNKIPHGAIGYKTPNELEAEYWAQHA
ncbi:MAG: integrase core domain-containing protein [Oscillospiraceae bacterium]|nr:integrase core domain-containing protein [Oscillospiraceae bacterium]MCI2190740.1 integrase core domain-containing protein [Oscillospiraceae bacterium]MCI2205757.1 integrase core domain-containing protein [Oscillospiraceae bacterium]